MMSNKIKYYVGEALKSIGKNRITSIVSITTAVATMFILGVFLIISLNVNDIAVQVSRDCEIQVFVSDDLNNDEYLEIGNKIRKIPHVSVAEMYTKEQTFEEVKVKLGDKAGMLDGLENDNPFRNSYKISLDDLNFVQDVSVSLKKISGIEKISDVQSLANIIVEIVDTVRNISLWLVLILCIVTAFIVSNAIKVSVYSRRKEINIMKYIGATDSFIRWPFIIEGIIIGLIGAVISFAIVWLVYSRIPTQSVNFITFFQLLSFESMALIILSTFSVVGIVIGVSGSVMSLRKHLRV